MLKFDAIFLKTEPVGPAGGISDKTLLNSAADPDRMRCFNYGIYIACLLTAQEKYEVIFEKMP